MGGSELKARLERQARAEGFATMGVCRPDAVPQAAGRLEEFVAAGFHGQMGWMEERMRLARRSDGAVAGGAFGGDAGRELCARI